jgi:hypothetical protein
MRVLRILYGLVVSLSSFYSYRFKIGLVHSPSFDR